MTNCLHLNRKGGFAPLAALMLIGAGSAQARAQTVLSSNLASASGGTETAAGADWLAASFTTDASAYTLNTITLSLADTSQANAGISAGTARLDLYENGGLQPVALVGTLTDAAAISTSLSNATFTASGLKLSANSTYWAVLHATTGAFDWSFAADDASSGAGFTDTWGQSFDGGANWFNNTGFPQQMSVTATVVPAAVPEPGNVALALAGCRRQALRFANVAALAPFTTGRRQITPERGFQPTFCKEARYKAQQGKTMTNNNKEREEELMRRDAAALNPRVDRRQMLLLGATGVVTLFGLSGKSEGIVYAQSSGITSTPALTEGPYWVDETPTAFHRSDVRANTDGTSLQPGLPLYLGLTVAQLNNGVLTPLPNAFVYIWSCNAIGIYSDEAIENSGNQTYLRGFQVSNAHGSAQFLTIYPSWYSGRTIHIHLRVRLYPNNDPTQTPTYDYETQLFFDDNISTQIINSLSPYNTRLSRDTVNTTDNVYTGSSLDADGVTSNAGALTQVRLAADASHAVASFRLMLNLSLPETTGNGSGPVGGGPGGGGPGGGGPGGPGGGPPPGG